MRSPAGRRLEMPSAAPGRPAGPDLTGPAPGGRGVARPGARLALPSAHRNHRRGAASRRSRPAPVRSARRRIAAAPSRRRSSA
ncbi:hypothetical protein EFP19_25440 [Burkholderia glumae]|nr:hypothetical protein EFP19_25440 [Burkholderia glumae]